MLSSQDRQFYKFFFNCCNYTTSGISGFFFWENIFATFHIVLDFFATFIFAKKCEISRKKCCKMRTKLFAFFSRFSRNVSFAGNSSQYLSVQCSLSSYSCLHMHLTVDTPEVSIIDVCILSRREDGEWGKSRQEGKRTRGQENKGTRDKGTIGKED